MNKLLVQGGEVVCYSRLYTIDSRRGGVLLRVAASSNNAINPGSKERRSFVAPLFAAGYGERRAANSEKIS